MMRKGFTFVTIADVEYTMGVDFGAHTSDRKHLKNVGHCLTITIL